MEAAIQLFTSNPAKFLQFRSKGFVGEGLDADLIVLDGATLQLRYVFAKGQMLKSPSTQKLPMFPPKEYLTKK